MGGLAEAARAVSAGVALMAMIGVTLTGARSRAHAAAPAVLASAVSLTTTAAVVADAGVPGSPSRLAEWAGVTELIALLVLLGFVARWSPPRTALPGGAITAAAATCWVLRALPAYDALAVFGGLVSMAVAPTFAVVLGGYSRIAATRLDRSLHEARQVQRLDLAHDLHDYVAHDVSGIVAQAQAARFAHPGDATRLVAALERIEAAGLQALSVMDQMVAILSDDDPAAPLRPQPRLGELPGVIDRFRREREGRCRVEYEQDLAGRDPAMLPRAAQATAHRVVVEAVTNIRRHASGADRVEVHVRAVRDHLVVQVRNDLPNQAAGARRAHGGRGLAGLRDRVEAVGGRFTAGPDRDGGWLVEAQVPLHQGERRTGAGLRKEGST